VLTAALDASAGGRPSAVVVHGEAGVGKTRLVREVCGGLNPSGLVLWGCCVRFGAASVPFAPVIGILHSWLAQTDPAEHAEVLSGLDELDALLPQAGSRDTGPGRLLPSIDTAINRITERHPTVLVVDDLHWSDLTSLDVLAYVLTGFRDQRLTVLASCRDEHRGEGHPLHGWLADMRRLPGFTEIHLDRLDLAGTEAQLAGLLGRAPDVGLAAQVHERSGGNPYLSELLVQGLTGDEPVLPSATPPALHEALAASWHLLSDPARRATRALAVGGRPVEFDVLAEVVGEIGIDPDRLADLMSEAQQQGVVQVDDEEQIWFRHPLLADVLQDGLSRSEARRLHAGYVRVLEPRSAQPGVAADLAVHSLQADRVDDAFNWSLVAAEQAAHLRATAEQALHLERACAIWTRVTPAVRGSDAKRIELLLRTSRAGRLSGRLDDAIVCVEQALSLVDRERRPLLTSSLLLEWHELTWLRDGPSTVVTRQLVEAVELTEAFPDAAERAACLAELSMAENWDGIAGAAARAEEAVRTARRSGSPAALARALNARSAMDSIDYDPARLADLDEADRLARECGDVAAIVDAAIFRVLHLQASGDPLAATTAAQRAFEEALAGDPPPFAFYIAHFAADGLLNAGHWQECRDVLRTALAARCGGIPGAAVRLAAARLALSTGNLAEAHQHWVRTLELVADDFAGLREMFVAVGAELFELNDQPFEAMRWVRRHLDAPGATQYVEAEDMLVPFASTAAAAAQAARDADDLDSLAVALGTLDDVIGGWPWTPFTTQRLGPVPPMSGALFRAEVSRCRSEAGQSEKWAEAAALCHAAGFPWRRAMAQWRCAEALLAEQASRSRVAELLRPAHATAVELGARPLRTKVESLAQLARVDLRVPVPVATPADVPAALAALTPREREILAFVVAGRSNGEIARELVISDKTVSVHVSNILRKTGTSNRVEVATLAARLDPRPTDYGADRDPKVRDHGQRRR